MKTIIKQLESAALEAHRAGTTWSTWWPTIAAELVQLELLDDRAYSRLVRRLLAIVASGDTDGMQPVGQWIDDDQGDDQAGLVVPIIDDVTTAARCLWSPRRYADSRSRTRTNPDFPGENGITTCEALQEAMQTEALA
jgi:hypothetical protein